MQFFQIFKMQVGAAKLLILSGDNPEYFHRLAAPHQVSEQDYFIRYAERDKVTEYLSAADAGLAMIRSANCERGSSPIKIGEYLASELPVVITRGIGDYSELIERENLGVVVSENTPSGYLSAAQRLTVLWTEGEQLKHRCRLAAEANLALKSVGVARYDGVYRRLTQ